MAPSILNLDIKWQLSVHVLAALSKEKCLQQKVGWTPEAVRGHNV